MADSQLLVLLFDFPRRPFAFAVLGLLFVLILFTAPDDFPLVEFDDKENFDIAFDPVLAPLAISLPVLAPWYLFSLSLALSLKNLNSFKGLGLDGQVWLGARAVVGGLWFGTMPCEPSTLPLVMRSTALVARW